LVLVDQVLSRPVEGRFWDSKILISNAMIDLLWSCFCCNIESLKILALCLLYKFIENYECPFPPSIEKVLKVHVTKSLKNHKSPVIRFLAYYICQHTFREPVIFEMNWYGESQLKDIGKCKIYIEPCAGVLLDNYGLTLFNSSSSTKLAKVPDKIQHLLKNGRWYWEFTVHSHQFLRICALDSNNGYTLTPDDLRCGQTFGVCFYFDSNKHVTGVYTQDTEGNIENIASYEGFGICLQLGSLQLVTFNFTSPTLMNVYKNVKNDTQLLTTLIYDDLPPFHCEPAPSYHQKLFIQK